MTSSELVPRLLPALNAPKPGSREKIVFEHKKSGAGVILTANVPLPNSPGLIRQIQILYRPAFGWEKEQFEITHKVSTDEPDPYDRTSASFNHHLGTNYVSFAVGNAYGGAAVSGTDLSKLDFRTTMRDMLPAFKLKEGAPADVKKRWAQITQGLRTAYRTKEGQRVELQETRPKPRQRR